MAIEVLLLIVQYNISLYESDNTNQYSQSINRHNEWRIFKFFVIRGSRKIVK